MKTIIVCVFSLLLIVSFVSTSAVALDKFKLSSSPVLVLQKFFHALQNGKIDRAIELTAKYKNMNTADITSFYKRISAIKPKIVAHCQLKSTAVVIFSEKKNDLDPAYIIRRPDGWFVLYRLTMYDLPYFKFNNNEISEFKKLDKWYKSQKSMIKEMLQSS